MQRTAPAAVDNLRNLDVLRAYAVLVVAGSHLCRFCGFAPRYTVFVANLGVGGVLVFFVHTALVLLLSMQRMKPNHLALSFYIRRAFRIYPLCWVAIALVLATGLTDADHQKILQMGWRGAVAGALLLQNVFRYPNIEMPLWSLPWEVQMYLFLPACYSDSYKVSPQVSALRDVGRRHVAGDSLHSLSTPSRLSRLHLSAPVHRGNGRIPAASVARQ